MFDVEKYEKIKKISKLISYNDLILVFSAFGFVYTIPMSSYLVLLYVICLCCGLILRKYLISIIKNIENE